MSRYGNWKNSGIAATTNITVIIIRYRECYDIKRNLGIFYIFFLFLVFLTSGFVLNFVCFRDIIAGFDIDESYNFIQHVI